MLLFIPKRLIFKRVGTQIDFQIPQVSKEDGLPQYVCMPCSQKIKELYTFQTLCQESDKTLRQCDGNTIKTDRELDILKDQQDYGHAEIISESTKNPEVSSCKEEQHR